MASHRPFQRSFPQGRKLSRAILVLARLSPEYLSVVQTTGFDDGVFKGVCFSGGGVRVAARSDQRGVWKGHPQITGIDDGSISIVPSPQVDP